MAECSSTKRGSISATKDGSSTMGSGNDSRPWQRPRLWTRWLAEAVWSRHVGVCTRSETGRAAGVEPRHLCPAPSSGSGAWHQSFTPCRSLLDCFLPPSVFSTFHCQDTCVDGSSISFWKFQSPWSCVQSLGPARETSMLRLVPRPCRPTCRPLPTKVEAYADPLASGPMISLPFYWYLSHLPAITFQVRRASNCDLLMQRRLLAHHQARIAHH
jgi:hypothetical protein